MHVRICVFMTKSIFLAGKQFEITDPKLQEFIKIIDDLTQNFGPMAVPDFMPWIKYCLPDFLQRRIFRLDMLHMLKDKFFDYCKVCIWLTC